MAAKCEACGTTTPVEIHCVVCNGDFCGDCADSISRRTPKGLCGECDLSIKVAKHNDLDRRIELEALITQRAGYEATNVTRPGTWQGQEFQALADRMRALLPRSPTRSDRWRACSE